MEKDVNAILNALERKAGEVLLSTNNFRNLWEDLLYEDFASNDFKTFGKFIN